jgi:hypothetical protein
MKLDLREKEGIAILVLSGQLTGGGGDEELREAIDTLLASGRNRILVDFRDVTSWTAPAWVSWCRGIAPSSASAASSSS